MIRCKPPPPPILPDQNPQIPAELYPQYRGRMGEKGSTGLILEEMYQSMNHGSYCIHKLYCNQSVCLLSNSYNELGLLDWPQGTMASVVAVDGDSLIITREVDGGKCEGV